MRVFLDDERTEPDGWIRVRWPDEAIALLETGSVEEISLDHDLGDDARGTGYDVLLWIEEAVVNCRLRPPGVMKVHSANVSARRKMKAAITAIQTRYDNQADPVTEVQALLGQIKGSLPSLEALLAEVAEERVYEDGVYRFYHQSWKVYRIQTATQQIVDALAALSPSPMNDWFLQIIHPGTGKVFAVEHNRDWLAGTRPMLEAFFHARYFLEMTCRYGRDLAYAPRGLPSGWATVLYLYGLR